MHRAFLHNKNVSIMEWIKDKDLNIIRHQWPCIKFYCTQIHN